jgi:hypothetical protein
MYNEIIEFYCKPGATRIAYLEIVTEIFKRTFKPNSTISKFSIDDWTDKAK